MLVKLGSEMVVRVQLVLFHDDEGTEDAFSGAAVVSGAVPVPVPVAVAAVTLYVVEQVSVGVIHSSVHVELDGYGGAVTKGVPLALPLGTGSPLLGGEVMMGGDPEPEPDRVAFGKGHSVVTEADSSDSDALVMLAVGTLLPPLPVGPELGDVTGTPVELANVNGA